MIGIARRLEVDRPERVREKNKNTRRRADQGGTIRTGSAMEGEHTAYVLRLLRNEDVSADLRGKSLYCLWTDYGSTWYRSVVEKCDPASGTASLYVSGCLRVCVSASLRVWVSVVLCCWPASCRGSFAVPVSLSDRLSAGARVSPIDVGIQSTQVLRGHSGAGGGEFVHAHSRRRGGVQRGAVGGGVCARSRGDFGHGRCED